MLTWIIICAVLLSIYIYATKNNNYWKKKGIRFIKPIPIFGNIKDVLFLRKPFGNLIKEMYLSCEDKFLGIFIFNEPVLLVKDLVAIKHILIKDGNVFPHRNYPNDVKTDPYGSNWIFFTEAPESNAIRKKLTPGFSTKKLKSMMINMVKNCEQLLSYLENETKTNNVIETTCLFQKYAVSGIAKNIFAQPVTSFKNDTSILIQWANDNNVSKNAFLGICKLLYSVTPNLIKLLGIRFSTKMSDIIINNYVNPLIKIRQEHQIFNNDFMDLIIEQLKTPEFEKRKILSQLIFLLAAGYETTTTSMTLTLWELAKHKNIQEKLRQELLTYNKTYNEWTYENITDLTYLDMCVKETLRLHTIVPFLDRQCVKDYKIPGTNILLEKGSRVFIPAIGIHNDPEIYPNPESYDPDRFSKENIRNRDNFTFLAFGEGIRNCIGRRYGLLSVKMGLANIIMNYKIDLCDKSKFVPAKGHFILNLEETCYLQFTKI